MTYVRIQEINARVEEACRRKKLMEELFTISNELHDLYTDVGDEWRGAQDIVCGMISGMGIHVEAIAKDLKELEEDLDEPIWNDE